MKRESRRRRDARGDGTAASDDGEDAREGRRDGTSAKSPARARRGGRDARDDGDGREIDDDARIARGVRQKSTKAFTKEPEKARKRREKSSGEEAGKKTPTKKTPAKTTPARGGNATGKEAETAPAAKRGRGRPVGTTKAAMAKRTGDDGGKKAGKATAGVSRKVSAMAKAAAIAKEGLKRPAKYFEDERAIGFGKEQSRKISLGVFTGIRYR